MKCNTQKEIKKGIAIEMEHAHLFPKKIQLKMAKKISTDHVSEFPCYYTKGLIPMEKKLKKLKRRNTN
jgi:hypothetical protein